MARQSFRNAQLELDCARLLAVAGSIWLPDLAVLNSLARPAWLDPAANESPKSHEQLFGVLALRGLEGSVWIDAS